MMTSSLSRFRIRAAHNLFKTVPVTLSIGDFHRPRVIQNADDDDDNDGIADTPYVINQWSNNIDQYPLMEPTRIEVKLPVEPEPTPSPEPTPTPTEEPEQTEYDMTAGAILAVTSIVVFLGLLFYFIKRK